MFDWFFSLFKSGSPGVEIIDKIELNVNLLESKLTTSKEKINECVQRRIFGVLLNYANLVAKIPKKVKPKQYKHALQQRIESVQNKLNSIQTTRSGRRAQTLTNNAAVQKAKSYISETVERMKSDQIAEIDYNNVLEKLTFHTQSLEVSGIQLENELQENLCIVFLELFLRTSSVKSVSGAVTRNIDVRTPNNQAVSQDSRINDKDNKRDNLPGVHGKNNNISSQSKDELTVNNNSFNNYGHWENFYFGEEDTVAAIPETSNSYNRCEFLIPPEMATSSEAFDNKPQDSTISDRRIEAGGTLTGTVSDEGSSNTCQRFYFGNNVTINTGNFNTRHQLRLATSEETTSSNTQGSKMSNGKGIRNALFANLPKQNYDRTDKTEENMILSYAAALNGKTETRTNKSDVDVKKENISKRQMKSGSIWENKFQNSNADKSFRKDEEKTLHTENKNSWNQGSGNTHASTSSSLLDQDNDDKFGLNDISKAMETLSIEEKSNQIDSTTGTGVNASSLPKSETSQIEGADKKCKYEEVNEKSSNQTSTEKKMNDDKIKENDLHFEVLNQIENELSQLEKSIEQFQTLPFDPNKIFQIKENVHNMLNNKLKKIPHNAKTCHMKKNLHGRSMQILRKLSDFTDKNRKCVEEALHMLNDMENEIYRSIESNDDFCKKRETLESTAEIMTAVTINVSAVNWKKTKIRNTIKTFLIAEAMKYMRELKEKLDRYKVNAKNFAYPKKVDVYQNITEEISSLEKLLHDLPKGEPCVDKRSQYLRREIKDVLEILEKKVKFNENNLALLQDLKEIEQAIESKKSLGNSVWTLRELNKLREKIGSIGSCNQKLKVRKMEIFATLYELEEKIYCSIYPDEVYLKKKDLNELEKRFQEDDLGLSKVQQYRDQLSVLTSETEVVMRKHHISNEKFTIFRCSAQLLFTVLKKTREQNKFKDEYVKKFQNKITDILKTKFEVSHKLRQLMECEKEFKKIKEATNEIEILSTLENIETMIAIEKSKLQLEEFNKCFQSIRITFCYSKHPFETYGFTKNINEIFDMKECVEDMPEGNPELDSSKQAFLKTIFDCVKIIDERLSGLIMKKKKSENILELHHHFEDFNPNSSDIDKESVEFVASIRKKAETFEEQVKYYSGTSYSKEYYVIYEKLMLLLEELDELCCEDKAVENATVECMSYIKGLIKHLNTNASSE